MNASHQCAKCGSLHGRLTTVRAYTNKSGWVRLCWDCAEEERIARTVYYLSSEVRRMLGEKVPMRKQRYGGAMAKR